MASLERERKKERTMNLMATTLDSQPVCNDTLAAHALHSAQLFTFGHAACLLNFVQVSPYVCVADTIIFCNSLVANLIIS